MTAEELINSYLRLNPQERRDAAVRAGQVVENFLSQTTLSQEEQQNFLLYSIGMFVAADGNLSRGELELFNGIYNVNANADQVAELFGRCQDPNFVNTLDELIDSMPDDAKIALCSVGLCVLTADGQLTKEEVELFAKILD